MKTKILSILALLLMTVTQGAWAQETLTVFDGTGKDEYAPAYMVQFDKYSRSQYIIPAANLATMNGKIITALKYYSDKSNYTSTCNVDVYLKEVGYTTFNSTPTFETKSGIVYTGKLSIVSGTLTITFTTPYTYNGGNLLIGMENTEKGNWASTQFYGQIVTGAVAFGYNSTSLAAVTANREDFIPKTTFTYKTPFSGGSGTQASPYLIASTTDWNNLVTKVNGGETYSGTYFKMTANVGTVSTWMTGTFSGTFDGYGNTLTVGYSATTNNCAPFGYLNGTVQNLKVAGNISTSKQYAGGLAAWVKTGHTANVTNCRVAATINSTYSGDGSSAGFVAYVDGRLNVTGCAFTGTLAGSNAYAWGGFVSYNVGTSVITNCLFAPASVTAKADYSATVGRNSGGTLNFANFYYTQKFNTAQGLQARTIAKGNGVSSLSVTKGSGTTYNVAGITVYSNGVDYNSTFYGGSGQSVSLALTAETRSGYQFTQYAASQGTLSAQTATSATLTMPAANSTANDAVTVTAQYSVPAATAVDLGLPSGKKWADMNVGATSETGYGTYYAWSSSDIATAQWGSNWRMPTMAEIEELKSYTDHEWATIGGVNGMKFMKKTDHSVYIFLPATGLNSSTEVGTIGYHWTSTEQSSPYAYFLYTSSTALVTSYYRVKTDKMPVRPVQMFAGKGTEASPYLISSTTDWNELVSAVNGGETYSGNYFKMTANVGTVSTWMTGTFSGTFDGDGKTLTVGYSATTNNCAPFGYLNGTVQNLKVAGNISTSKQYAGGVAAWVKTGHTANVTNCRVAVTINSTYSGDGSSAGFVAYVDGRLNVTGCAFTGTLAGSNAYAWGGFVSYNVGRSDITNCLFAPASVTAKADNSATVGRNGGGTLNFATNFYYTQKFNTAQGIQARTIAKGNGVSSLSVTKGSGTTYNVAGITVYSNGVDYNSTFYGGSGQSVSLALTAETRSGYQFTQYAASQGTLSAQTATSATLTMPAANSTANDAVTISAEYDPLYNATFADASDASNGWSISPTSGIVGSTVTVRYEGENKVKSVTVAPKGALTGKFSVSSTKQVQFSKGNLQYDGSAWSFHTNQYDCVFTSNGTGTATSYPMDIFCWGNIDNPAYDGSTGIGTNGVDLSGSSDWGSNTITNGCTGWRTLTLAEWEYLFANHSYGYATVAGQTGVIILPDVFTDPMRNNGSAAFVASTASWTANVYAAGDDWTAMEKAGALFLPAAGGRDGSDIKSVGIKGSYWSSTADTVHGHFITFEAGSAPVTTYVSIHKYGKSVRLVKDVE